MMERGKKRLHSITIRLGLTGWLSVSVNRLSSVIFFSFTLIHISENYLPLPSCLCPVTMLGVLARISSRVGVSTSR